MKPNRYLVLVGQRFDAADLATLGVLAASGAHVNLRVILELFGGVEDAAAVVAADHGELAVLAEVGRRDQLRLAVELVPQRHLLVGDVPQAQLAVQRAAQKIAVVLKKTKTKNQRTERPNVRPIALAVAPLSECTDPRVESDGRNEVNVLETAQAFLARYVPQSHRFIHRRRQDEVILHALESIRLFNTSANWNGKGNELNGAIVKTHFRPRNVQQVGRVSRIDAKRFLGERRTGIRG